MGQEQKLQNLADTLARSGLACSPNEALRMAESIAGTEKRVAKNFDEKNQRIDDSLTRKRTYQEEVDYLIEKTSMEHKKFHVPIKGYKLDSEVKEEPDLVEKEEPPLTEQFKEVEEVASEPAKELEELDVKEIVEEKSELEDNSEQVMEEDKEDDSLDDDAELELAPEPKPIVKEEIKPVQSDLFDDDRSLKEIMEEDAKNVYKNAAPAPEPIQAVVEPEAVSNLPREKEDDFIGESVAQPEPVLKNEPEPDPVQAEPEQYAREIKEDRPEGAPPKKPIDDVDLMDYFKF